MKINLLTLFFVTLALVSQFAFAQSDEELELESLHLTNSVYDPVPRSVCNNYIDEKEVEFSKNAYPGISATLTNYNKLLNSIKNLDDENEKVSKLNELKDACRRSIKTNLMYQKIVARHNSGNNDIQDANEKKAISDRLKSLYQMGVNAKESVYQLFEVTKSTNCTSSSQVPTLADRNSCNQFEESLFEVDNNKSVEDLTKLSSLLMIDNNKLLDDTINNPKEENECSSCFNKLYADIKNVDSNIWPAPIRDKSYIEPIVTPWTSIPVNFSNSPDNAHNAATKAINDYLTQNLIKQELLKISVVMEQFNNAIGVDSNFKNESILLGCVNPTNVANKIVNKCRSSDSSNLMDKDIIFHRLRGAMSRMGMKTEEIGHGSTKEGAYSLKNAFEYMFEKVSKVTNKDLPHIKCAAVNRTDVVRIEAQAADLNGSIGISKILLDKILVSHNGKDHFQEFVNAKNPMEYFSALIRQSLEKPDPNNPLVKILSSKDNSIFSDAQKRQLAVEFHIELPIDFINKKKLAELQAQLPSLSYAMLGNISHINPNMFMFLNDPNTRNKMGNSKEQLLEKIHSTNIDESDFRSYAEQCEKSYEKISDLACSDSESLSNFSQEDIVKAAKEMKNEFGNADSKTRALASIALEQAACRQSTKTKADKPVLQELDLQEEYQSTYAQSDFMRDRKNLLTDAIDTQATSQIPKDIMHSYTQTARLQRLANAALDPAMCIETMIQSTEVASQCLSNSSCQDFARSLSDDRAFESISMAASLSYSSPSIKSKEKRLSQYLTSGSGSSFASSSAVKNGPATQESAAQPTGPSDNKVAGQQDVSAPISSDNKSNLNQEQKEESVAKVGQKANESNPSIPSNPVSFDPKQTMSTLPKPSSKSFSSSSVKQSKDSEQISSEKYSQEEQAKRNDMIGKIMGDKSAVDYDNFSTDELESLRRQVEEVKSSDSKDDQNKALAEIQQIKKSLETEREELKQEREAFMRLRQGMLNSSSPSSSSRSPASIAKASAMNMPQYSARPSDKPNSADYSSSSSQSDRSISSAGVSGAASGGPRHFMLLKKDSSGKIINQESSLKEYLSYVEENALVTQFEAISFSVNEKNQRVVKVPKEDGYTEIVIDDITDPELKARIKAVEKTQIIALTESETEQKSLSPADILSIIEAQEKSLSHEEKVLDSKSKLYSRLLETLDIK